MKLLIAALLAVFSTGAMAEWTYITSTADKTVDVYFDKATIRKRGNVVKVWELRDFKAPQGEINAKPYLSIIGLQEYDCAEIKVRLSSASSFGGNMGSGEINFTHQFDDSKWADIPPGSIGMDLWQVACKK
jgi:hypothetical protein